MLPSKGDKTMLARPSSYVSLGSLKQRHTATYSIVLALLLGAILSNLHSDISRYSALPLQTANLTDLSKLPLSFEPNMGQTDPQVRFLTRVPGGNVYFTPSGVALALRSGAIAEKNAGASVSHPNTQQLAVSGPQPQSTVHIQFTSASPQARVQSGSALPGKVNYLLGNDPAQWHTGVPTYSGVEYSGLYQ